MLLKPFSCFVLLLFSVVFAGKAQQSFTIRVMTYNIRHASPPSKPTEIDVDTIAAVIGKYKPDLVALQEVDVYTSRSGKTLHEAKAIAEKLKMHYYFGKAIDFAGGEYGVAILSKFPIVDAQTFALPSANEKAEKRAMIMATVKLNSKNLISFACTHLDAEEGDDSRLMQIRKIDNLLSKEKKPVLLAGDLNSEPSGAVIQDLDTKYTRTCLSDCANSFSNINPNKVIDYIAYRKRDSFKTISHQVLEESYPSDHLPVLAELQFNRKRK